MIEDIKTMTGLPLEEALQELDAQLPPEAYSPVPGAVELTDIDPNWMRAVLNRVFGPCGYGWGYNYAPEHLEIRYEVQSTSHGERGMYVAVLKHLRFWYKLHYSNATVICDVHATGASAAPNVAHAMKGALTNAIGHAASNVGFQQSVYLGLRNHRSVRNVIAPVAPDPDPNTAPAPDDPSPSEVVVHFGKMKGKTIEEINKMKEGKGWLQWCAENFQPKSKEDFRLKKAVQAFLAASEVHP